MEQPPPLPPPPPDHGAAAGGTSNAKLYTLLAWLLAPPIGSLVMLFVVGRTEPDAKFNAANATAVHGAMLAVYIVLYILALVFFPIFVLVWLWYVVWLVVWIYGIVLAVQSEGRRFRFPVATDTLSGLIATLEGIA